MATSPSSALCIIDIDQWKMKLIQKCPKLFWTLPKLLVPWCGLFHHWFFTKICGEVNFSDTWLRQTGNNKVHFN